MDSRLNNRIDGYVGSGTRPVLKLKIRSGAGAKLAETAARAAESPQSLTALRNVIILAKTVASIDPELLRCISMAVSETMSSKEETATDSPSMLALLSQFRSKELRRSVGLINRFLNSLGKQLKSRGVAQG